MLWFHCVTQIIRPRYSHQTKIKPFFLSVFRLLLLNASSTVILTMHALQMVHEQLSVYFGMLGHF